MRLNKAAISLLLFTPFAANAALVSHSFDNGDSLAAWEEDRRAPAGFEIIANELVLSIDGSEVGGGPGGGLFYDTQGMKLDIGESDYLSIDIYIDEESWVDSARYGGIWGVGYDNADVITSYPILEYWNDYSDGNETGVASWDNSGWSAASGAYTPNAFNTFAFMTNGSGLDYFLNDTLIHSETTSGTQYIGDVILNAKNVGGSYSVRYDNLVYGQQSVPLPGTLLLMGLGGTLLLRRRRRSA